jgi:hypothetical protein
VQDLNDPTHETGYDTSVIIENKATTPVVLVFIHRGREVSAMNTKIAPPQADPSSILQPGEWKHVHTFEGHVIHVRQLKQDGSLGLVLLQHRAGLIPVGAKAADSLLCPLDDPEPIITVTPKPKPKEPNVPVAPIAVWDPKFERTERPLQLVRKVGAKRVIRPNLKECNQLDVGFRNLAGCPLNGYFVRPGSCEEVFRYHLGVETNAKDFEWDWNSPTKFEHTFIGSTFVFRPVHDPEILVERIDIQATQVTDCPDLKQTSSLPIQENDVVLHVTHRGKLHNATATLENYFGSPASNVRDSRRTKLANTTVSRLSSYAFDSTST